MNKATFRFYEELNDFLPVDQRKQDIAYPFTGNPAIKDPIEAIGIPHTEVELIIVNGDSVGFGYRLQDGDRVAVYPMFESMDVSPIIRLRDKPLRNLTFICDVHLGKLARLMRILGLDTLYRTDYTDAEIVGIAVQENRIILTRDRRLLHHRVIQHGYWIRSQDTDEQMHEVLKRFDLKADIAGLTRCPACNGKLERVAKDSILEQLEPLTIRYYNEFFRCVACGQIYWKGSHFDGLKQRSLKWIIE